MAIQRNKFLKTVVIKSNKIIHKIESNNKPHQITTTTTTEATVSCVLCCNWCEVIHLLKYEMYFKCMFDEASIEIMKLYHFEFIVAFNAFSWVCWDSTQHYLSTNSTPDSIVASWQHPCCGLMDYQRFYQLMWASDGLLLSVRPNLDHSSPSEKSYHNAAH